LECPAAKEETHSHCDNAYGEGPESVTHIYLVVIMEVVGEYVGLNVAPHKYASKVLIMY
jgi:hypothetical protein